jgi:formamidopyrimidine-DNA glycosylase
VLDDGGLWRALRGSRCRIKTQLLSQRPLAGVGNIYADEALWRAGIHPARRTVTRADAGRLLDALRTVLAQGIANGGTTLRDYRTVDGGAGRNQRALGCYGRAGQPCLRCGMELRRSVVDGRGTTHCPGCQRRR